MRMSATEDQEQSALFERIARSVTQIPELSLLFHIPNGGYRSPRTAAALKKQGVQPGVPDLFLPVPCGVFHGLWIEMKRTDARPSDTKPVQLDWHKRLVVRGYRVEVCKGWEAAWAVLTEYLSERNSNV